MVFSVRCFFAEFYYLKIFNKNFPIHYTLMKHNSVCEAKLQSGYVKAVNWFRCIYPFTGERCSRKLEEDIDAFEIIGEACTLMFFLYWHAIIYITVRLCVQTSYCSKVLNISAN